MQCRILFSENSPVGESNGSSPLAFVSGVKAVKFKCNPIEQLGNFSNLFITSAEDGALAINVADVTICRDIKSNVASFTAALMPRSSALMIRRIGVL